MRPEDLAQELELAEWEARQQRAILPKAKHPSATHCNDRHCGIRIPAARRKAMPGVQFCAECQARQEQQQRRG